LLYRVASAVAAAGTTIVGAKVSTLGSDAVDVFFVTDPDGEQLSDIRAADLRATLLASVT
jgi:[protein-PII] uridylyltransferase